ncbi:MAG: hypothetical protein ACREK6_14800 [Candidatus Rokuibacteriota bacterium]
MCAQAREFLSRVGIEFDNRSVEDAPVDRAGTLALTWPARRLLAKSGEQIVRVAPITEADAVRYLLHPDGFLRVPVLVIGGLLVRGYTEELYREALGAAAGSGAGEPPW